ncbi:MAG: cell division protein ZapA [Sphingorhabdus sp.]
MADVRLQIAGREYVVTCRDGEEERLVTLGKMVDDKAQEAGGSAAGLNESRQLLFASLLLADKLSENGADMSTKSGGAAPPTANEGSNAALEEAAETLEKLADRIEEVANKLEQ